MSAMPSPDFATPPRPDQLCDQTGRALPALIAHDVAFSFAAQAAYFESDVLPQPSADQPFERIRDKLLPAEGAYAFNVDTQGFVGRWSFVSAAPIHAEHVPRQDHVRLHTEVSICSTRPIGSEDLELRAADNVLFSSVAPQIKSDVQLTARSGKDDQAVSMLPTLLGVPGTRQRRLFRPDLYDYAAYTKQRQLHAAVGRELLRRDDLHLAARTVGHFSLRGEAGVTPVIFEVQTDSPPADPTDVLPRLALLERFIRHASHEPQGELEV